MKLTKSKLKQIIKEEFETIKKVLSEGTDVIDRDESYRISGETIIELRGIANELLMSKLTMVTARLMHTLLKDPNVSLIEPCPEPRKEEEY